MRLIRRDSPLLLVGWVRLGILILGSVLGFAYAGLLDRGEIYGAYAAADLVLSLAALPLLARYGRGVVTTHLFLSATFIAGALFLMQVT